MILTNKKFNSYSEDIKIKLQQFITGRQGVAESDEIYFSISQNTFLDIISGGNEYEYFNPSSVIKKVSNLSKSMSRWAGSGFKRVQQHVYERRLAICRKCSFWEEKGNLGMGKCLKCGCGKGKHWLPHEQCPIGLWGKENV